MTLTPHNGQLRIECDDCGIAWENTHIEDATSPVIKAWLEEHGWVSEIDCRGDHEYFCPECAEERR